MGAAGARPCRAAARRAVPQKNKKLRAQHAAHNKKESRGAPGRAAVPQKKKKLRAQHAARKKKSREA